MKRLLVALFLVFSLSCGHNHAIHEFLDTLDLSLPLPLHVVFVGFDRSFDGFGSLLEELLPKHTSHILDTEEPLVVTSAPQYILHQTDGKDAIVAWKAAIEARIQPDGKVPLAKEFSDIAASITSQSGNSIIFLNHEATQPYYFSRPDGTGCTQSFIGEGRSVIVDLSASQCRFGRVGLNEGAVTAETWPRVPESVQVHVDGKRSDLSQQERALRLKRQNAIADLFHDGGDASRASNTDAWFESRLAAAVVHSVKTVFAPDVALSCEKSGPRIVIPIVVLRDHNNDVSIDIDTIQASVQDLAAHRQSIVVEMGVHSISDYPHIGLALAKAHRTHMQYDADDSGAYHPITKEYIDSRTLSREMQTNGAIVVAAQLSPSDQRAFLIEQTLASVKPDDDPIPIEEEEFIDNNEKSEQQQSRFLPIFVFALSKGVLLDEEDVSVATCHGAIVIHAATEISVPIFSGTLDSLEKVKLNMNASTNHIIGAISAILGGIVPPIGYYDKRPLTPLHEIARNRGRFMHLYTFAYGFHPFAPSGFAPRLPALFVDHAMRNTVLVRISAALSILRSSIAKLKSFASKYLADTFRSGQKQFTLEKLYHGHEHLPITRTVVARLHDDLLKFESRFEKLKSALGTFQAHALSRELYYAARAYQDYLISELNGIKASLQCCRVVRSRSWL